MKTDNKIDLSKWNKVIELESIAEKLREDEGFTLDVNIPFISGFIKGADWEKEKNKLAVNNFDKLVEALKESVGLIERLQDALSEKSSKCNGYLGSSKLFNKSNAPIWYNAKQLLESIKQQ